MSFNDAINLMTKEIESLKINLRDVIACYGLSKMTIANEMNFKGANPYLKLIFVEFLEFIGRIAELEYK